MQLELVHVLSTPNEAEELVGRNFSEKFQKCPYFSSFVGNFENFAGLS